MAKRELKLECDYTWEAAAQGRFKALIEGDPQLRGGFHVPGVVPELSAGQVLTSEWVEGYSIDKARVALWGGLRGVRGPALWAPGCGCRGRRSVAGTLVTAALDLPWALNVA